MFQRGHPGMSHALSFSNFQSGYYMNNSIEIFKNDSFGEVRVAGTSEEPLFCLADVCRVLEIKNVSDCKARLDERGVVLTDTPTFNQFGKEVVQKLTYINEKNLYKVIMRSDKPQAEPFQDWVCGEVLPSIRKHGAYMTEQTLEQALLSPDYLIRLANQLKDERQRRIEAEEEKQQLSLENKKQAEQIAEDAPRVLFSKAVETAKRSCLMAELAKILQQNGVNIGQNRLFQWMRDNGYLCSKGQYYNQLSQKAMETGLFELKQTTINKPDGTVLVSTTTKVTGKGQLYFVNGFLTGKFSI